MKTHGAATQTDGREERRPINPSEQCEAGLNHRKKGRHLAEFPKLSFAALERRSQVSELTIRHELDVQEVKTALTVAVNAKEGFRVAEFLTWPLLYQFEVSELPGGNHFGRGDVLVKPDAFRKADWNKFLDSVPPGKAQAPSTFFGSSVD